MGEQGSASERSDDVLDSDQDYGKGRCHVLDLVVRIFIGVNFIDHNIDEYLANLVRKDKGEAKIQERHTKKVRKMNGAERRRIIKTNAGGEDIDKTLDNINRVKDIRNDLAHSTATVSAMGTTKIKKPNEGYNVDELRNALRDTESCRKQLKRAFGLPEAEESG